MACAVNAPRWRGRVELFTIAYVELAFRQKSTLKRSCAAMACLLQQSQNATDGRSRALRSVQSHIFPRDGDPGVIEFSRTLTSELARPLVHITLFQ